MHFYTYFEKSTWDDLYNSNEELIQLKQQVPVFASFGRAVDAAIEAGGPSPAERYIFCKLYPLDFIQIIEAAVASIESLNIDKLSFGVSNFWHINIGSVPKKDK